MNAPGITGNLPVIRAHYADILCQLAEDRGLQRSRLLTAAGIRPSMLGHPDNFITVDQFSALCRESLVRSGDPALGLEYGKRLKFTTHGSLAQAAISCDTLEQALTVLIKYFQIRFVYMRLSFFVDAHEAVIQLDLAHGIEDLYRFNVDVVMASLMDVNLLLFGNRLLDGGCCLLDFPEPTDTSSYRQLFGNRIFFGRGVNQLRFKRDFLGTPMSLSNPVTRRIAEAQCEEEMRFIEGATSVSDRVMRLLETGPSQRLPSLEDVAEHLRVSTRTLRRQLAAEGVRFQQLQDSLRHRRALGLLRRNELTIDEIADALGYSDPSNFGRAFRKWEGLAPSAWRREHQKS
ncbi:AraC family transcriptional regulator [Marinobacter sp.]|uniref:AraC family transcriptional regulator n=1 Tax=Marinobacter sp. TaxID=50741 RepID=UPI003561ACFA